ncbi:MAG: hypothetical protein GF365_00205 [Candidatus Buchananbacteria bacterium]|nr:hypothetical protein [Candidatus Buchananbacteria bacterium]
MFKKFQQQIFLVISLGLALFIVESIIKYYIILNKIPRQGFYFFSGLLQIDFFTNPNIAFGLPLPQTLIIILVIFILICLSFFWYLSLFQQKIGQLIALSLIILGSLSNLLDRLIFGYVIDYINIFIWPVFNLADAMIVTGIIIYLILNFKK